MAPQFWRIIIVNKMLVGLATAAVTLAACGGGGGSSTPTLTTKSTSTARSMNVTFKGASVLGSSKRATLAIPVGTVVTVTYNGTVVGTGTFDAQSHAAISIDSSVPAGARVTVNVGPEHPSIVLAQTTSDTIVTVVVNADGTLQVTATNDVDGSGIPNANDTENQENDLEDQNGNVNNGPSPGPSGSPSPSASPVASAPPSSSPSASPLASASPSPGP
jgi:hypothetical protein